MNETDQQLWQDFLHQQALLRSTYIRAKIEVQCVPISRTHLLLLKPKLRHEFTLDDGCCKSMLPFMMRNGFKWRTIEMGVFDQLWDDFERKSNAFQSSATSVGTQS